MIIEESPEKKKELEDMNSAIEQYLVDLDALLEVIRDWDPVRKVISFNFIYLSLCLNC